MVCRDLQFRTIRGIYQLKLAAQYASLTVVPFDIVEEDLMSYNSYSFLYAKKSAIDDALWKALEVRHPARAVHGLAFTAGGI